MAMKPLILSEDGWSELKDRLSQDYPASYVLIREVMKTRLGFTARRHTEFDPNTGHETCICLDFYDEAKRTFFLVKYTDYLK
jgi:hypothetical protein